MSRRNGPLYCRIVSSVAAGFCQLCVQDFSSRKQCHFETGFRIALYVWRHNDPALDFVLDARSPVIDEFLLRSPSGSFGAAGFLLLAQLFLFCALLFRLRAPLIFGGLALRFFLLAPLFLSFFGHGNALQSWM